MASLESRDDSRYGIFFYMQEDWSSTYVEHVINLIFSYKYIRKGGKWQSVLWSWKAKGDIGVSS